MAVVSHSSVQNQPIKGGSILISEEFRVAGHRYLSSLVDVLLNMKHSIIFTIYFCFFIDDFSF